ncbi:MAG: hypothetical protein Q8S14_08645 [Algoriphagus sp.]|nr:hypothetical protein [Algoriphagus sp.]
MATKNRILLLNKWSVKGVGFTFLKGTRVNLSIFYPCLDNGGKLYARLEDGDSPNQI